MTNRVRVILGGREYQIPLNLGVMERAEEIAGMSTPLMLIGREAISARVVRAVVQAGLEAIGAEVSEQSIRDELGLREIFEIGGAMTESWMPTIPVPEGEKKGAAGGGGRTSGKSGTGRSGSDRGSSGS